MNENIRKGKFLEYLRSILLSCGTLLYECGLKYLCNFKMSMANNCKVLNPYLRVRKFKIYLMTP